MPRVAMIVDVQVDFCEAGALPVEGGNAVAQGIAELLQAQDYDEVIASRDAHNALPDTNGGHFAAAGEEPNWLTSWPVHCVEGTGGSAYHPALGAALPPDTVHVREGAGKPSYCALEGLTDTGTPLSQYLHEHYDTGTGVVVHVMGLAIDYAVVATALGLRRQLPEAQIVLLSELSAGIHQDTTAEAIRQMDEAGIQIQTRPGEAVR